MDIPIFDRPLPTAWTYPCSAGHLRDRLKHFAEADTAGLHAIGLVPSTSKHHGAYARYFRAPRPVIHIYSLPASLSFQQPPHVKRAWLENSPAARFGMCLHKTGSRWLCRWEPEDLQRFLLEYVLAHEIGHHVYEKSRYGSSRSRHDSEQFAHAYAERQMKTR